VTKLKLRQTKKSIWHFWTKTW